MESNQQVNASEEQKQIAEDQQQNAGEEDNKMPEVVNPSEIEEEKKSEELKANENIQEIDEFATSAEYHDQILKIQSVLSNYSFLKEIIVKYYDSKALEIIRANNQQIDSIDLVELLIATKHSFKPKRLLNAQDIIRKIRKWLKILKCCVKG